MNRSVKLHQLTLAAILVAIILVMTITPLGYLHVGVVSISFLAIPVVIGGIVLGPAYGGVLGAVFGITSFAQCFGIDAFGTTLMSLNPAGTFLTCLVPRILIGVFAGLLYPALRRADRAGVWSSVVTAVAGSLTNTVFFVGLVIFFFKDSYFGGSGVWAIIMAFFSVNVVLEAVVCGIVGAAFSRILSPLVKPQQA
jgi:uncharacterized membrane protein